MDIISYYIEITWSSWSSLFSSLPYGDPWLAWISIFSLCFFIAWRLAFGPRDP